MSIVKTKWSRVLAMILAVVMAVMAMPMGAFAAAASDLPEEMLDHSTKGKERLSRRNYGIAISPTAYIVGTCYGYGEPR